MKLENVMLSESTDTKGHKVCDSIYGKSIQKKVY